MKPQQASFGQDKKLAPHSANRLAVRSLSLTRMNPEEPVQISSQRIFILFDAIVAKSLLQGKRTKFLRETVNLTVLCLTSTNEKYEFRQNYQIFQKSGQNSPIRISVG